MEQGQTSSALYAWPAEIREISHQINEILRCNKQICYYKQCFVFKCLLDSISKYLQLWWTGGFEKQAAMTGQELLGVLKKGLQLLQQFAERESSYSSFVILGSAGQFFDIFEDVKRYAQIINRIVGPGNSKESLILQDKVELDFNMLQNALKLAHEQDKDAHLQILKDNTRSTWSPWGPNTKKRHLLLGLIKMLENNFNPGTPTIAMSDLKIQEFLGRGISGSVSKALWCGKPVAIKEFFYHDVFESEWQLFMKLKTTNSCHIVHVLGHLELKLVIELMDMDLRKLIERKKKKNLSVPFSGDEAMDIVLQIAKGMRDLHGIDVIHRDIKPGNILVKARDDGSWIIKLADFGVSKADFRSEAPNTNNTGTRVYMAPEMVTDSQKYTKKVDVYSFGIVCAQVITGCPADSVKIQEALREGRIPSFALAMIPFILSCLELEAHKRPSFEEICDHLWNIKEANLVPHAQAHPKLFPMFSYAALSIATKNFSHAELLGGSFYIGTLPSDGSIVAVKVIHVTEGYDQFVEVLHVIRRLRHKNLVDLRGWCHEEDKLFLVYDYMPYESLDKHLFSAHKLLLWPERYKIVKGVAEGIAFLHDGLALEQRIVHGNIKAANVLLERNFMARLGDFGLTRLMESIRTEKTMTLVDTVDYLASDIYSFGILLLEIACGKSVPCKNFLLKWVWEAQDRDELLAVADPRIDLDYDYEPVEIRVVLSLGLLCSHPNPDLRPTMRECVQILNYEASLPDLPNSKRAMFFHTNSTSSSSSGSTDDEVD